MVLTSNPFSEEASKEVLCSLDDEILEKLIWIDKEYVHIGVTWHKVVGGDEHKIELVTRAHDNFYERYS